MQVPLIASLVGGVCAHGSFLPRERTFFGTVPAAYVTASLIFRVSDLSPAMVVLDGVGWPGWWEQGSSGCWRGRRCELL